jgi:regulator of replication initiation timing
MTTEQVLLKAAEILETKGWVKGAMAVNSTLTDLESLLAKATPLPWTEDDENIFSEPLDQKRSEAIERRLSGSKEPHPDEGLQNPLGWIATTEQGQPNGENDVALILGAVNELPNLIARIRELEADVDSAENAGAEFYERAEKLEAQYADTMGREFTDVVLENKKLEADNRRLRDALASVIDIANRDFGENAALRSDNLKLSNELSKITQVTRSEDDAWSQVDRLENENASLRAVVKWLEWCDFGFCPECNGHHSERHDKGCTISAALNPTPQRTEK